MILVRRMRKSRRLLAATLALVCLAAVDSTAAVAAPTSRAAPRPPGDRRGTGGGGYQQPRSRPGALAATFESAHPSTCIGPRPQPQEGTFMRKHLIVGATAVTRTTTMAFARRAGASVAATVVGPAATPDAAVAATKPISGER